MRRLLDDLCAELEGPYRRETRAWRVPVSYFRHLGEHLALDAFGGWKVAGWLEDLNDLVYFVDLAKQLRRERDLTAFAEALWAECEEKFYEHGYGEDLFPRGRPQAAGLAGRIERLCAGLAGQVRQESLFLVPGLPCRWLAEQRSSRWEVQVDLDADVERAELAGHLSVGLDGAAMRLPRPLTRSRGWPVWAGRLVIQPGDIRLNMGRQVATLATLRDDQVHWHHPVIPPRVLTLPLETGSGTICLGPTLLYGKDRKPIGVVPTASGTARKVQEGLTGIAEAWPEGAGLLARLTTRVVPLRARGVVSFSYRHRPGLSFINLFDRDRLDLLDDLVHENSHHHLNLLLRKYVLYRGDRNQEIFYSPWRRRLRPLRGILHASFTFTMGAMLFERLSSFSARSPKRTAGRRAGLTKSDLLRSRFRCLEEIDSVRYSLLDLTYAKRELGWITNIGQGLLDSLWGEIKRIERRIAPFEKPVLRSRYGAELRQHRQELAAARGTYGPISRPRSP
jgi:HEXXH motif-containing protein